MRKVIKFIAIIFGLFALPSSMILLVVGSSMNAAVLTLSIINFVAVVTILITFYFLLANDKRWWVTQDRLDEVIKHHIKAEDSYRKGEAELRRKMLNGGSENSSS